MISIKTVTVFLVFAAVESATFQQGNIPVEVKYDGEVYTPKQLRDESKEPLAVKALKNLDAKVQLSPDELSQALKHLPAQHVDIVEKNGPKDDLEHLDIATENSQEVGTTDSKPPLFEALLEVEYVINNGLEMLKNTFILAKNQPQPDEEQWAGLNRAVNELVEEEKSKIQLRQTQAPPPAPVQGQNILQNLATGLQNIFNNFTQNLQANQNNRPSGQGDVGTPGLFQGFVNNLQGGPTTSSMVPGETGTGISPANRPSGIISNIFNRVQQFFGQAQGGGNQTGGTAGTTAGAPVTTQGDTGVSPPPPAPAPAPVPGLPRPVQVIQSISSAINNLIQGNQPLSPNTTGDEGSKPANGTSLNIIQRIRQNISSAIQNNPFNIFRPQTSFASSGAVSTPVTLNPTQAGIQNVGNQIQQSVPGLPGQPSTGETTEYAQAEESNAIDSNKHE